ncbi:MAG: hypothetical protein ABW328_07495 [Ilumatobacteraceae bacterium]
MVVRSALDRRAPAVAVMGAGVGLAVLGSFLPWVRTGGRRRNSYDLFAIVGRLGFAPDGLGAAALRWWPLVPLLAVVALVLAWWGWPRVGGGVGIVAALYAGGIGLAVSLAPDASRLVRVQVGAPVTGLGGAALLVGSVAAIVIGGQHGSGGPHVAPAGSIPFAPPTTPTGRVRSGPPAARPDDRS